jgi:hypothetical protein
MTPEETQNRFDVGAEAVRIATEREREHNQGLLSLMPLDVFVETLKFTADKVPQEVVEDVLREAASRIESLVKKSGCSGGTQD